MAMNIDPRFADQLIQIQTRFLSKKDLIRFMKCHLVSS